MRPLIKSILLAWLLCIGLVVAGIVAGQQMPTHIVFSLTGSSPSRMNILGTDIRTNMTYQVPAPGSWRQSWSSTGCVLAAVPIQPADTTQLILWHGAQRLQQAVPLPPMPRFRGVVRWSPDARFVLIYQTALNPDDNNLLIYDNQTRALYNWSDEVSPFTWVDWTPIPAVLQIRHFENGREVSSYLNAKSGAFNRDVNAVREDASVPRWERTGLALQHAGRRVHVQSADAELLATLPEHAGFMSPDGRWLVLRGQPDAALHAQGNYAVYILSLEDGTLRRVPGIALDLGEGQAWSVQWSPDSRLFALMNHGRIIVSTGIHVVDAVQARLHPLPHNPLRDVQPINPYGENWNGGMWSPDGRWLLVVRAGADASPLTFVDTQNGNLHPTPHRRVEAVELQTWSPDGMQLGYVLRYRGFRRLYVLAELTSDGVQVVAEQTVESEPKLCYLW